MICHGRHTIKSRPRPAGVFRSHRRCDRVGLVVVVVIVGGRRTAVGLGGFFLNRRCDELSHNPSVSVHHILCPRKTSVGCVGGSPLD